MSDPVNTPPATGHHMTGQTHLRQEDYLFRELGEARREIERLQEKNRDLNRRCQQAEAAYAEAAKAMKEKWTWKGGSFGRAILAYENGRLEAEVSRLRAELERLRHPTDEKYACGCLIVPSPKVKAFCPTHLEPLAESRAALGDAGT